MSLMNYLGAVASAAMEAASQAAIQQHHQGPMSSGTAVSVSRGEAPVTAVVSTASAGGNTDASSAGGGRPSVTMPQGLTGFPVVPITIHHSSGPSGQITYAVHGLSNGPMRLGHPHVSSGGSQRIFTLPAGMNLAAGQVPGHFSIQTGNASQPTVELRLPHPPTLSSQVPTPVGSHLVDKQQRGGVFQMNPASFRGPSIPVTSIPQPSRPIHQEHEIRREINTSDLRLKSPPAIPNLNSTRPSVLMRHRNPHEYMSCRSVDVAAAALQDHNYTLPKRSSPIPSQPQQSYAQVPQQHHHHKEPVVAPPPTVPTLSLGNLRAASPPNNKIHMPQPPPSPLSLHPKPPPPALTLCGNVRGTAPSPPITASEVVAKSRRPRSESPASVPGRRRRRKTLENNEDHGDIVPGRKPGVPGRKRSRKAELQPTLNNTIPPYHANLQADQDQLRNSLNSHDEHNSGGVNHEHTKRRLKKNKLELALAQYGQEKIIRKGKDKHLSGDDLHFSEKSANLTKLADAAHMQNDSLSRMGWDAKLTAVSALTSPKDPAPPSLLWSKPTTVNNVLTKDLSSETSSNNTSSKPVLPEDSNSEGITRCICDYLHDDGFMICCDKCSMWQHVDCMGIDRSDIPEAYLCEICNPRWVSKARARAIQDRKKEMMDLGVVEDDSTVGGDSDQDARNEKSRSGTPAEPNAAGHMLSSPGKSTGKLKRRGRPSLSNGQPFSDSDSEMQSSPLHSPNAKRSRKYSGKRGQNLMLDFDSPSKISRKRRSSERGPRKYFLGMKGDSEPPKTRRSYTRRNTLSSPLSSPSRDDSEKVVEDHKENSLDSLQLDENGKESDERGTEFKQDEGKSDANGLLANSESRRKRKQIFKDIPNGDLSPPHIISSAAPSLSTEKIKSRSPSFDKSLSTNPPSTLSNNISASNSPEPSLSASSSLHINVNFGFNSLCPYSSSPYLDKYEEAENAVCSYSPELRAKLLKNHGGMLGSSSVPDFTPLPDDDSTKRWKLGVTSLEGGKKLKTLMAAVRVEPGQAIIEFIGKFLMHTGFVPTNKKATPGNPNTISPEPFVFFHQVPKNGMCICIDSRKYGNDARFVRRSCVPNAEIRHVVGKGTIHAYVVATAAIDVDEEVTIPHEFKSVTCNTMNSVVQKYHVLPPPLPCACSDLDTCKAVMHDPVIGGDVVLHKKNGALVSPTSAPQEIRERKRRMSSRRTSLVEKEPMEPLRSPTMVSPQQQQQQQQLQQPIAEISVSKPSSGHVSPIEEIQDITPSSKDRNDGRTTRARTSAIVAASEEPATPVTSKRKSDATVPPPAPSIRQRHRSGAEASSAFTPSAGSSEQQSAADSHKMTREERKLQSVLKIIEKMESNQKKKENRQNQKKDKVGKDKRSDDRETDHDEDSQSNTSMTLAPIRFAPMNINKKKGRKRGRSSSKSGIKPQMIMHRNSGSIADLRSTSTESDINSADESSRAGMSPLQENMGPNFRLPKKKEMMSEWRIGSGSHASPSLPSQYMRKTNAILTAPGATTPPVQPSTSSSAANFLVLPVANGNLDNASAKKRWLRQAISEETDPSAVPSPNSRPSSPVGVECIAPLKKRRLARASMSSEVSNTPPSTPNNTDAALDADTADAEETEQNEQVNMIEEEPVSRDMPTRKWSCSEVSSAEEDMEDLDDGKSDDHTEDTVQKPDEVDDNATSFMEEKCDKGNSSESSSPNRSTTPRRSRWDQVDAPEPVVNSSNSSSPVKTTADAIVLDYVRNPEQYAKLTGNLSSPEKGAEKESLKQHDTGEFEDHQGGSSQFDGDASRTSSGGGSDVGDPSEKRENVESSPKTPTQVKKKLSMEEYFKRKKEGHSTEEKPSALSNPAGTALNSITSTESNSSDVVIATVKDSSIPTADGEPTAVRGTLQFSSTPTLAERKREELGKRLSKSFGIRVPDADTVQSEKTPTLTSPRESLDKHKPNGEIGVTYTRSANVPPPPPPPPPGGPPPIMGHRLSVPTPAALKQSGMPPLPLLSHQSSHSTTPNGATKSSSAPNGYVSSASTSQSSPYNRHYRGTPNGPSSYTNHQHPNSRTQSSSSSNSSSSSSQGPIIGGVPVGNLIPPPPPPTATQGTGSPAFAKRFYNKRFFPS